MWSAKSKNRFNLLLLEEGEVYFEDFSAYLYLPLDDDDQAVKRRVKGRLKLCSSSLLFEPDDHRLPVSRYPFVDTEQLERLPDNDPLARAAGTRELLVLMTRLVVEMKENNLNVPYVFRRGAARLRFSLNFGSVAQLLPRMQQLHSLRRAAAAQHLSVHPRVEALVQERERAVLFDPSWLVDIDETRLLELSALRVAPLVRNPGRLLVTNRRLYFQPLNNIDAAPVTHFALADVAAVLRRRHVLRPTALEVQLRDGSAAAAAAVSSNASSSGGGGGPPAVCFALASQAERDALHELLERQPAAAAARAARVPLHVMTRRWQHGAVDTFTYLSYLNAQAGRTVLDLTQYPVFPWVLADYSSAQLDLSSPASFRDLRKPIGALNAARLATFRERLEQMRASAARSSSAGLGGVPPFLYGTHYSTPGYVLFYLVRQAPECMLRLQNGKFDAADRMFHSIAETWHNCLTNPSDVKELIPEFFGPADGAFLRNTQGLQLGVRASGEPLGDVVLPPWARGDPAQFVALHRAALESEYVSANLHHWIDLIFGHKQRGEAARAADNLFYHLTYEGAVDLDAIADPLERAAIETQINEFGQCPRQLFTQPHPARLPKAQRTGRVPPELEAADASSGQASFLDDPAASAATAQLEELLGGGLEEVSGLDAVDLRSISPAPLRSPQHSSSALTSAARTASPIPAPASPTPGAAGGTLAALERLATPTSTQLHRGVVMGACVAAPDTLFSVSQDSTLKLYSLGAGRQLRSINVSELALSACVLTPDEKRLLIASWDNNVYLYSAEHGRVLDTLAAHDDAVSCLAMRGEALATGSWDSTVKLWPVRPAGIGKAPLADFIDNETEVRAIDLSPDGRLVVSGAADGTMMVADVRSKAPGKLFRGHADAVCAAKFTADGQFVLSASADKSLRLFRVGSYSNPVAVVKGAEKLTAMWADDGAALVGSADGALRLYSVSSALVTERKCLRDLRNLKDSAGNKASEPISCVAVSRDRDCIVTGAGGDGTIRIWRQ